MQGVKAVVAESYERIHRSNLVGMGIVPLQFLDGQNADSLGLTGKERFGITIPQDIRPKQVRILTVLNGSAEYYQQLCMKSMLHSCTPSY